jgi:hypothetical protein
VEEWITIRGYVAINERRGVSGAIRSTRIWASAMANMNAPQWNKPAVGSPQNGNGGWFDTRIKYWYGLGGIEAVLKEV